MPVPIDILNKRTFVEMLPLVNSLICFVSTCTDGSASRMKKPIPIPNGINIHRYGNEIRLTAKKISGRKKTDIGSR